MSAGKFRKERPLGKLGRTSWKDNIEIYRRDIDCKDITP
jgi:hypothetical protein